MAASSGQYKPALKTTKEDELYTYGAGGDVTGIKSVGPGEGKVLFEGVEYPAPAGPLYSGAAPLPVNPKTGRTYSQEAAEKKAATMGIPAGPMPSGTATGGATARTQLSYTRFPGVAPTYTPLPDYVPVAQPTPMEKAAKTQEYAGLGLREARRNLRETVAGLGISGKTTNPAEAQALRAALQAHGINVEGTIRGARVTAESELAAETARKEAAAQFGYAAKQQENINKFTSLWTKYQTTGVQVATSVPGTGFTGTGTSLDMTGSPYTSTLQRVLNSKKGEEGAGVGTKATFGARGGAV